MGESTDFVRSMYDAFNRRDLDFLADQCDGDTRVTLMAFGQVFEGPDGFRQFAGGFIDAFPDIAIESTNLFASDDQVASEFRVRGTHTGTLRGPGGDIPPTQNRIDYPVAEVWRLRDSRVTELHNYFDSGTLMRQLGLA